MGTEILAITYLTTPLIFLINVMVLFKRKFPNPKAIILLALNTIFIGYFLVSGVIDGYLIQAFLVGGFLLIPFQLLGFLTAVLFAGKLDRLLGNIDNVT
ncbi:hypothetical protein Q4567_22020 [Aliiglaciecola sp. 2_MG-2023]|uniref:hypothetical protein n=1 Tax=unclassified Aliiglaciecola TaxID=2593648 RepID=UPI0026E312F2|nr:MULTISPECIES: hypothetical protein [unclassified Aliiglaciecola]MDO6713417.1 hypothetical protein [Aliiglaciecola sp. 2_MG-2023]MDO6754551.1 hypothetical protein [Aliiglaciecola sp. 1_MG-2023]|tara:strand:- start:2724 stop:3020 length:297 start_codon:yes stop_codon:yes gene_type:complete